MSSLTDKYTKNYSTAKRKEFEKRVFENLGICQNYQRYN